MIHGLENLLPASEIAAFHAALLEFSDRCIRVRIDRATDGIPFQTEPVPWFGAGRWIVNSQVRPGGELPFAVADYYIQDAASLLPLRLLDVKPEDRICDLCAAPGGKATAIAERLGPDGLLIANEAIQSRLEVLRHNLARTGRANYATCRFDPDVLALRCTALFNKVLVDVPCSGQTLVGPGKHDESAFRPQHIEHCSLRAQRILSAAARLLAPGGTLVLSTCTFSIEENESQIEWLHREFPGVWEPLVIPELSPWQSPIREGCYRLWPHRDRCRGGFAAALRKVGETPSPTLERTQGKPTSFPRMQENLKRRKNVPAIDIGAWLNALGSWPIGYILRSNHAAVEEPGVKQFLEQFEDSPPMQSAAVALLAGKHLEPTHALAMACQSWFRPIREVSLSDSEAIAFMTGQSLSGVSEETAVRATGSNVPWVRALWEEKPLGWLKESSNRWNNHLPSWGRMTISASSFGRGHA